MFGKRQRSVLRSCFIIQSKVLSDKFKSVILE